MEADAQRPKQYLDPWDVSKLSFYWYSVGGALITVLAALILSLLMPEDENKILDPKLFAPIISRNLRSGKHNTYAEVPLKER